MKVSRMNKIDMGNLKAFFDLETSEGFTLKGFKIVMGTNGLFVSFPSQKNKDGEYSDTVWATKEIKAELSNIALDYFNSNSSEDTHNQEVAADCALPF